MPMYLKRDAIRFIEASVSAISMAVAALGMPRRYDFREVAAENAVAIGLAGVAAELSMSAVIVQAQGEDALKFPTGFYKTGSHIVDDFKKLVGSQIPKMMFLTQGIEEPSAHIAKLLEMASKLKLLTKLRAGGLHAGRGPSMDVSIACVNDVIAFISLLGASSRITVLYGSASELRATLDYDFAEEKKFSYKNLSMEEIIHHLAFFVSRLWQIHVFGEGNTRTTAVFFIKYLRTLGFDATNDIFAENAWYFRNALVRANYNDLKNGVHETTEYLELFLRNLLLDEKNELHNRTMHISGRFAEVDIERVKVDIKSREVDIESTKVDIRNKLLSFSDTISEKTINHTVEIFSKCGKENCFGRTIVEEITGLKPSRASKLIKLLVDSEVIVPVTGHGKGKYRFQ